MAEDGSRRDDASDQAGRLRQLRELVESSADVVDPAVAHQFLEELSRLREARSSDAAGGADILPGAIEVRGA